MDHAKGKKPNVQDLNQKSQDDTNMSVVQTVPISIIMHYAPYRNTSKTIKSFMVLGTRFEMESKYQIIDAVGQGAYGVVIAVRDTSSKNQEVVAIKKIEKAFDHKIFTKRTLRELKIQRLLNHENIIRLKDIFLPRAREKFEDIYCVYDLMETDMAQIIRSPQPLTDEHIQFFLYQILRGLKYLHSCQIMHRDLKPRNLLMNANCDLKICDFGLARPMEIEEFPMDMTDYVATRWYRAPELLLGHKDYTPAIDVWSVGCILAELIKRKPLLPGIDSKNQFELIVDLLGTPPEEELNRIPKEKFKKMIDEMRKKKPKDFDEVFAGANSQAIDLLKKMLTFDSTKRISVNEALCHDYLKNLHNASDEPVGKPVEKAEFEFERHDLNREQLKDMIYEEVLLYHFEDFKKDYLEKTRKGESIMSHILKNDNSRFVEKEHDIKC